MGKNNEGDCECLKVYGDTLKWLDENKGRLLGLLNGELNKGEILRYILSGNIKTKSMKINDILERLVYDFSQEKNISQKDIIQAALIEFLKKYGYEHEVKVSLQI